MASLLDSRFAGAHRVRADHRDGEVTRGWFGIEPQPLTPDVAQDSLCPPADGVLIRSMQRGGPAEHAVSLRATSSSRWAASPRTALPQLLARIAELPPGSNARCAGPRR